MLQVLHHVSVCHPADLVVVAGGVCGLLRIVVRQVAVLPQILYGLVDEGIFGALQAVHPSLGVATRLGDLIDLATTFNEPNLPRLLFGIPGPLSGMADNPRMKEMLAKAGQLACQPAGRDTSAGRVPG